MTPGVGGQSTSETEEKKASAAVCSDHRFTVRMIANELSTNSERVWTIITEELGDKKDLYKSGSEIVD